ncbi:hypothetical protein [Phaffia rhodozyma]|uniref:Uncharacterized protein n=1 Tax=Phaffia rhodozyma TaxID=264483 RepID=A0A0F7ST28_PHARH|nr:hypothetical protein [Phaffia rhodozyma]
MNSQAPILMSAETAWPRRPTPRKTPYTSPQSGDQGVPEASTSVGPTSLSLSSFYDNENFNDYKDSSTKLSPRETPRWKQNLDPTSRLDPQKIARIAQAFGVNLSLPQSRSLDSRSSFLSSLALPSTSSGRHSQQRSVSASSSLLTTHSVGSISRAPSPLLSPAKSAVYVTSSPRRVVLKPKHLVCVSPPANLKSRYPQALLLLQPTYKAQLEIIAREYRLPTTVGLVLFLVINTLPLEEYASIEGMNQAKKHKPKKTKMRIGQDTWVSLWGDVFDSSSAYHHQGSDGNATASPESVTRSLPASHLTPLTAVHSHNHSLETLSPTYSASHASSSNVPPGYSHTIDHIPPFSRLSPSQTNNPYPQLGSPGRSLLHRSPSSLSPASLTKRKRPPISLSRQPANHTPTPASDPLASTSLNQTFQAAQPLSATHFLAPPVGEDSGWTPNLKPPELRIVGSLEFGIDGDRAGEWWDAWIKKKGISVDVREEGVDSEDDEEPVASSEKGVQTTLSKFSGVDSQDKEHSSFGDSFDADDGYAQLEDEDESKHEEERGGEIDDLLEGMLPSDELEWIHLRDSRNPSSAFGKGRGDLPLSAKDLSFPLSSSFDNLSAPFDRADSDEDETDEFTLNAREVNSMLAAHPNHPISVGFNPVSSSSDAREVSAPRRLKNTNLTLDLDSNTSAFTTLLNPTTSPHVASSVLGSSTRSNLDNSHPKALGDGSEQTLSPTSDASAVELAYLKRRAVAKSVGTEGSLTTETMDSVQTSPFGTGDDEYEVGNRGSALLMHDKLNDLENILRSLSPRDLSVPSRSHALFTSLAGQKDQALLFPARIDASDPMDRMAQSVKLDSSVMIHPPGNGVSHDLPSGSSSIQSINGNEKDSSSTPISPTVSTINHDSLFNGSLLSTRNTSFPAQLPRASSHRSLEDTDTLSVKSRHSDRLWAFPREKGSPMHSSHDLLAEKVFDLNEHAGSSETSSSPLPSPQRPRMSSSKSSKGFRGFRWVRSSEDASPPLPAEISALIMVRPDMPVGSNTFPLSGATTDLNDHYRYGESSSPLVNQFGQRMDITPDMSSSGFGEPIALPSPTSPKDGRGSAGHSSRKRFKAPFSPGHLFGSKSHKHRPPMEISAPELISIYNQTSNGPPGMTAFHHRSRSEHEVSQRMSGSSSMQALQRQQQQHPGKFSFTSPPTSPNSISSPSSPRTVRRKPVPGMPSASPSIASLSQQMHRMSSASEESAFSPRLGTSTGSGIEPFTLAPPLPDSPLKTMGLSAQMEEADQKGRIVGLGFTRPPYVTNPGLDEPEGLA